MLPKRQTENSPESKKKPNLGILEIPWRKEDYVDKEIDDSKNWMPKDEDVEFLKKTLEQTDRRKSTKRFPDRTTGETKKSQLSEVIKKDSFTIATITNPSTKEIRVSRAR